MSLIRESPAQFENRIKPRVYIRRITGSTMYEKAAFCQPEKTEGKFIFIACEFSPIKIHFPDQPKS